MPETFLVTGGAGFVGSTIALGLKQARQSVRVVALDNLRRRGSELNLPRLRAGGVEFVHGDIREPDDLATVRPNWIIECSAEASVQAGYDQSPDYLIQSNLVGCYRCLELARRTDAGMVFLSTSRVYPVASLNALAWAEEATRFRLLGEQTAAGASARGVTEEFATAGARSLYGMTKLAAELMIEEYGDAFDMPYVINRCGLIAGPWQMGKSDQGVVALWMAAHCFGRELRYIGYGGTGKQVRDVLHVDDLVELTLDQVAHSDSYGGQTFNVGGGVRSSLSLLEMTALCHEISGRTIAITPEPQERKADLRVYLSDSAKVEAVRGWKPKRPAAQTLEDIHKWIQSRHADLAPVLAA